jgi:electron transfer flavoprotein alpha subunit
LAAGKEIITFSEKKDLLAELITGACSLDVRGESEVSAVVWGPRQEAETAAEMGARQVYWLGERPPDALVEDCVPSLARLVHQRNPYGVLVGSTRRGKAVAGRLAARCGTTVVTDVLLMEDKEDGLHASHMIFGGGAVRKEKVKSTPVILTIGPGVFDPQRAKSGTPGEIVEVPFVEPEWRVTLRERKARPPAAVHLGSARKVVCPGRGVANQADLAMIEELARLMGAELACTRPLAEGLGWLPRERYIGISGAFVKPEIYLGIGVSGQVQHTVGMSSSRLVVAINKDANAPIFSQADYGIVGDLYAVVPALINAIKARR